MELIGILVLAPIVILPFGFLVAVVLEIWWKIHGVVVVRDGVVQALICAIAVFVAVDALLLAVAFMGGRGGEGNMIMGPMLVVFPVAFLVAGVFTGLFYSFLGEPLFAPRKRPRTPTCADPASARCPPWHGERVVVAAAGADRVPDAPATQRLGKTHARSFPECGRVCPGDRPYFFCEENFCTAAFWRPHRPRPASRASRSAARNNFM